MSIRVNLNHPGELLIEIVVAIGIIGLVLVGVTDLMTRSARVVTFQKQKDEALSIVRKKLNEYKTTRDTDPESFYNTVVGGVTDPCVPEKDYKCIVSVDKQLDSVLITVVAEWNDGGRTYNVSLSQSLYIDQK